ncbi:MAG: adenosylcobinamide-GDP ribazoletransferase [Chloroflexi bacterium]|nr:MAG: adenosylcobinamide-GDP ribazoletransferase [Chloroflexota bacterium]
MKHIQLALSFLTVIPMRVTGTLQPRDRGRPGAWFPAGGLLIGLLLAGARFGLDWLFTNAQAPEQPVVMLVSVLVVALWAGLTGGLHLDGLADCCDGLLAAVSSERRLEIMKDPRLGTFGGAGLVLYLLSKVTALAALPAGIFLPLLLAPVLARWLILIAAWQPMARPGGLGAEFAAGVTWRTFGYAALVPLVVIVAGGPRAVVAAVLAHLAALAIFQLARSRLGGVTGDVLGLIVEITEVVVLLVYAAR